MNYIINIYLLIEDKKIKSNIKCNKLILKEIGLNNEKKEMNCQIYDNVELKLLIRNINKYGRKKSNTIHKKNSQGFSNRSRLYSQPASNKPGMVALMKEKIKYFAGEYIKKQIYKTKVIPEQIEKPSLFQKERDSNNEIKDEKKR